MRIISLAKKPKLGDLKKKLWKLTSDYVRLSESDGYFGQCVTCGIRKQWRKLQAGHFIPKAQGNAVYFDLRNVHTQCFRCNINLGGNGPEYYPYMLTRYGQETIDELRRLSNTTVKFTQSDYLEMIEDMKQKLEELG